VRLFIEPFERLGLRYFVTGGVATVIYGDPRFTRDVDVVLALEAAELAPLRAAFDPADFYVPPEETLREESTRESGGHFNLIHARSSLRADVYLAASDPLHAWAFEHRRRVSLEGSAIWVAPIEYVLVRKLEYYVASDSDRHLRDVATMLRVSGDAIDQAALGRWIGEKGLAAAMARADAYDV
jgi:hypothetical protein